MVVNCHCLRRFCRNISFSDLYTLITIPENQNKFIAKKTDVKQTQTLGNMNRASNVDAPRYIAYALTMKNHNATLARPNDTMSIIPLNMYNLVSFRPSYKEVEIVLQQEDILSSCSKRTFALGTVKDS